MRHPAGKVIDAHVHNPVVRDTKNTLEVLFLKRGRLRVDFFTGDQRYLESRDVILLTAGGHGFLNANRKPAMTVWLLISLSMT
jgi:hypothetical protein